MKLQRSLSATDTARGLVPRLLAAYLRAGRKLTGGKPAPKELHKFRIATKKFRYTVELFLPIYGTRLDRELDAVREMQRLLGKLHDYHVIGQMLAAGPTALQAKLKRSASEKLKEFRKEWSAFESQGQVKRWKRLLAGAPSQSRLDHSKRKARRGSTEAARRAGTKFASSPTKTTPKATTA